MALRSPMQQRNRSCLALFLTLTGLVLLLLGGLLWFYYGGKFGALTGGNSSGVHTPLGIGITVEPDGEHTGISDGTYAFDTDRIDGLLKSQGSDQLKKGNVTAAKSDWQLGLASDTSDAEALIYLEDQRILASGDPFVTFVVGTMLTGGASNVSAGRDNLQGAYVAQKEYNDGSKLPGGVKVRLLIANAGGQPQYAMTVAQQIVQAAKQDRSIVGVMGWPFSAHALQAVSVLAQAHIPMVSPTASSDSLTGKSPYFFRAVPSNNVQAIVGARYAEQQLNATSVALFVDPKDAYSSSLANDFSRQFTADGNQIVATEDYTVGQQKTLPRLLQDALNAQPDLIYFAGYADDMGVLLTNLPASDPGLHLMGGDALYELQAYSSSARPNYNRLRFTAFAYPDEWIDLGYASQQPAFFKEYSSNFNPNQSHPQGSYGYTRADNDAILSYDAMMALLQGYSNAFANHGKSLTPSDLRQGLAEITGSHAMQGVSGQISFASNGDPINKAVVILYADASGHTVFNSLQGCFIVGPCSNP